MYKHLLKYVVFGLSVFLIKIDCAVAKPFRYIGVGGGVNVHGNNDGSDTDMRSDSLNVQGTLRIQLPVSNNISVSNNFFYANDDPNDLIAVNLHLNPLGSVQPRVGIGANIVFHNAPHNDAGILGHKTSPVLNVGIDAQLSKQLVLFGDAYYAVIGNKDSDGDSGSLAVVAGLGIRF